MNVSRRSFFKGIAAASAALAVSTAIPGSVVAALKDPRLKAWHLLNEADHLFKMGDSESSMEKIVELFSHLQSNFKPTEPPSKAEMVRDCGDLLRARGAYEGGCSFDTNHWRTCYPSTFAIMIVRDGLKHRRLPMIQTTSWKMFSKQYTEIVMAA